MHHKERIIVTCGEFDPLSYDELLILQKCHLKGDWLIVGVHSDWWMMYARGGFMQSYETRREIIKNINQHIYYKKTVSTLPMPMERAQLPTQKGTKILEIKSYI